MGSILLGTGVQAVTQAHSSVRISWQSDARPGAVGSLPISLESIGLIVVDLQHSCADPDLLAARAPGTAHTASFEAWSQRLSERVIPNTRSLLGWFRAHRRPIIFTRVGSLLPDAEDQHPWRRLAWLRLSKAEPPYRSPVGAPDHAILPRVAPLPGELVLDKNATGALSSSALDFYLHQMGLQTLVVLGVATFACVDNTARALADRGYNVILVEDACAGSPGRERAHDATLRTFGHYFGAVKTAAQVLGELDMLVPAAVASGRS